MTRSQKPRWILPALGLVLLLALVVRVFPAREAVLVGPPPPAEAAMEPTESGIRLLGVDAYFHLRHSRHVARNFPSLMRVDPWFAYPTGARVRAVGLYALGTGGAAWALGAGNPSERLLQQVMAWTPAILGLSAHLILFAAAAALWGATAGLVATALLIAYPGTFLDRTLLGFSDHHAAEVVLVLLLLLTLARLLPGTRNGPRTHREGVIRGVAVGLVLVAFNVTWVGAPLWLVLVGACLPVGAAAAVAEDEFGKAMAGIAATGVTFAAGLFALTSVFPILIMEPSALDRSILAGIGIAVLIPAGSLLVAKSVAMSGGPRRLAGALVLLVGVGVLAALLLWTPSGQAVWAILTDVRTALVSEHARGWRQAINQTGPLLALLASTAPFVLLARAWRSGRWADLAPVVLSLLGIAVALQTGDFGYIVAPLAAFIAAGSASVMLGVVQGRAGWLRWSPAAVLFVTGLAPVLGLGGSARPWRSPLDVALLANVDGPLVEAMRWLGSSTPDPRWTAGLEVTDSAPEGTTPTRPFRYGVLAAWDHGNAVASLGERPVIWSVGPIESTARLLLGSGDSDLDGLLRDPGAPLKYVVVDDRTLGPWARTKLNSIGATGDRFVATWGDVDVRGHQGTLLTFGPGFERSLAYRLYYEKGVGLGRYRLVFQSSQESVTAYIAMPDPGGGFEIARTRRLLETEAQRNRALEWASNRRQVVDLGEEGLLYQVHVEPSVQIFENVEGALIAGEAPVGRSVHVGIMVQSSSAEADHNPFLWESTTIVDAEGRWAVRVPYATDWVPENGGVGATSLYRVFLLPEQLPESGRITSDQTQVLADGVQVTEAEIQAGAVVQVTSHTAN